MPLPSFLLIGKMVMVIAITSLCFGANLYLKVKLKATSQMSVTQPQRRRRNTQKYNLDKEILSVRVPYRAPNRSKRRNDDKKICCRVEIQWLLASGSLTELGSDSRPTKYHRQAQALRPHVETECKENSARNVINKVISSLTNFLF